MAAIKSFVVYFVLAAAVIIQINAQLTPNFYERMFPQALPTIRTVVRNAITNETRMGWEHHYFVYTSMTALSM